MTADQLEQLGEEIATFAARSDVVVRALLTRLRIFDAHEAWGPMGFTSCAHWLSWRAGIGLKTAREKVRVARALGALPKVDALFGRGELSYSKVRAITRAATPANEQDMINAAMHTTASQVELLTRAYKNCLAHDRDPADLRPDRLRFVRRSENADGMVRIVMQLEPEEAAIVWEAIMSAAYATPPARADLEASAEASAGPAPEASAEAFVRPDAAIGRALWLRDGACRVPGCDREIPHAPPSAATGRELEELDHFMQDVNLQIDPMRLGEALVSHSADRRAADGLIVGVVVGPALVPGVIGHAVIDDHPQVAVAGLDRRRHVRAV